jgi:ribosomal protein S18 acetylase RimI-like enzyme
MPPRAFRIVEEKGGARSVARRVRRGLIAYNQSRVGAPKYRDLVLSARDSSGKVAGGLVGQLYWNALYVELLWLDAAARGSGTGSRLMREAESIARREGRELIYLNTYSFQAPGFYRRLGFRSVGRIVDYPRGASRIFLVKRLRRRRARG